MWAVYSAWDNPFGEDQVVVRCNRKTMQNMHRRTWPLPFEGGKASVTSVLQSCGWSEFLIRSLKTMLFDQAVQHRIHANCTPEQVCWPDLQQAFRSAISGEEGWHQTMDDDWPPLAYYITLRLKVEYERIVEALLGEWRMYCKPQGGEPFSYGLCIRHVDLENWTFEGGPRYEGNYTVENGRLEYSQETGRLQMKYDEVWPNGQRDALSARVKSNGKFQCVSVDGFEQNATREDLNLPLTVEGRIGEAASKKVSKYYDQDPDAAADFGE